MAQGLDPHIQTHIIQYHLQGEMPDRTESRDTVTNLRQTTKIVTAGAACVRAQLRETPRRVVKSLVEIIGYMLRLHKGTSEI